MFSMQEKQWLAQRIEELLLSLNHPEMPRERPSFKLHVDGTEAWSWADIEPNWKFDDKNPAKTTAWNEEARGLMEKDSAIAKLKEAIEAAAPKYPYEPPLELPDTRGIFIGSIPTRVDVDVPVDLAPKEAPGGFQTESMKEPGQ